MVQHKKDYSETMKPRKKELLIRLLYFVPLTLFILMFIGEWRNLNEYSSYKIKYLYVYLIPIVIFTYQTIRNSRLGWILVMILFLLFLFNWIYRLIGQYSMIVGKYTAGQYFLLWIFVLIYVGIGIIYIKFRPEKLII